MEKAEQVDQSPMSGQKFPSGDAKELRLQADNLDVLNQNDQYGQQVQSCRDPPLHKKHQTFVQDQQDRGHCLKRQDTPIGFSGSSENSSNRDDDQPGSFRDSLQSSQSNNDLQKRRQSIADSVGSFDSVFEHEKNQRASKAKPNQDDSYYSEEDNQEESKEDKQHVQPKVFHSPKQDSIVQEKALQPGQSEPAADLGQESLDKLLLENQSREFKKPAKVMRKEPQAHERPLVVFNVDSDDDNQDAQQEEVELQKRSNREEIEEEKKEVAPRESSRNRVDDTMNRMLNASNSLGSSQMNISSSQNDSVLEQSVQESHREELIKKAPEPKPVQKVELQQQKQSNSKQVPSMGVQQSLQQQLLNNGSNQNVSGSGNQAQQPPMQAPSNSMASDLVAKLHGKNYSGKQKAAQQNHQGAAAAMGEHRNNNQVIHAQNIGRNNQPVVNNDQAARMGQNQAAAADRPAHQMMMAAPQRQGQQQKLGVTDPDFAQQQFLRMQQLREQMVAQPMQPRLAAAVPNQQPQMRMMAPQQQQQQPQLLARPQQQMQMVANPHQQRPQQQVQPAAANGVEDESDTYRESVSVPGADPHDINQGERFVFLANDANSKMRQNKRKVRYVFDAEEEVKNQPKNSGNQSNGSQQKAQKEPVKRDSRLLRVGSNESNRRVVNNLEQPMQNELRRPSRPNCGESGQTPENYDKQENSLDNSSQGQQSKRAQNGLLLINNQEESKSRQKLSLNRDNKAEKDKQHQPQIEEEKKEQPLNDSRDSKSSSMSESAKSDQRPKRESSVDIRQNDKLLAQVEDRKVQSFSQDVGNKEKLSEEEKSYNHTEQLPQNEELCNNNKNYSVQANQNKDNDANVSINSSFSGGSAFGNYSFAQASQAAIKAEAKNVKSEANPRRSRHRSTISNDSLSEKDLKFKGPQSQYAPSPSSQLGNGHEVMSMQVNRSRDEKHSSKQADKYGKEEAKSKQQPNLQINLGRLNSLPEESKEPQPQEIRQRRSSTSSSQGGQAFDASKELRPVANYKQRRGSMVENRTEANQELFVAQKEVRVRTPRRGRSKSIVVPGTNSIPRSFPIGRLNNYNKTMKKHKAPLSFVSELESIDEVELSDKFDSSKQSRDFQDGQFFRYDADEEQKSAGSNDLQRQYSNINNSNKSSNGGGSSQGKDDNSMKASGVPVKIDEMQKIVAAQRNRQRSQSVAHNAPQLQPIKNFGHGRRSNLVQKVQQLQRRAQRSKSIAIGDINSHQILMHAQMLLNAQELVMQKPKQGNAGQSQQNMNLPEQKEQFIKLTQNQLSQLYNSQKQGQFSDYLMQFKNSVNTQQAAEPTPNNKYIRDQGPSVKPLGLDKNKARAALNNLKSGNLTPKHGNEQSNKSVGASVDPALLQQQMQQPQMQPAQLKQASIGSSGSDSSFGNYTFQNAQNVYSHHADSQSQKQAQIMQAQKQQMELLQKSIAQQHAINLQHIQDAAGHQQQQLYDPAEEQKQQMMMQQSNSGQKQGNSGSQNRSAFGQYKFGQSQGAEESKHKSDAAARQEQQFMQQAMPKSSREKKSSRSHHSRKSSSNRKGSVSNSSKKNPQLESALQGGDFDADLVQKLQSMAKNGNPDQIIEFLKQYKAQQNNKAPNV